VDNGPHSSDEVSRGEWGDSSS
jgi:hypothetical protein